jgi:hypothetical protein
MLRFALSLSGARVDMQQNDHAGSLHVAAHAISLLERLMRQTPQPAQEFIR